MVVDLTKLPKRERLGAGPVHLVAPLVLRHQVGHQVAFFYGGRKDLTPYLRENTLVQSFKPT